MMNFEYYLKEGEVKKASKDVELAKSLLESMKSRARFVLSLEIRKESSKIIFENIYEAIREGIDALMALSGYKSYSHAASIAFLERFKEFPESDRAELDKYRKKRNGSKYYGKGIEIYETEKIVFFYKMISPKIEKLAKDPIK